jgi:hypothetical protein
VRHKPLDALKLGRRMGQNSFMSFYVVEFCKSRVFAIGRAMSEWGLRQGNLESMRDI